MTQIETALTELCSRSQTFLGFASMLALLLGVLSFIIGAALSKDKFKLAGKVLVILAILGIVVYVATPFVYKHLLGYDPLLELDDDPCYAEVRDIPPHCGSEYCSGEATNETIPENCTCIWY